jgi:hypothetical protein
MLLCRFRGNGKEEPATEGQRQMQRQMMLVFVMPRGIARMPYLAKRFSHGWRESSIGATISTV